MTNVMKSRRKITQFELFYQGQITGMIPKYSFPQSLPFCSCSAKANSVHKSTADLVILKFYGLEIAFYLFIFSKT